MDDFETLDDQVSEDEIKQDEEEGKKEEKEEEKLDVIGRQSVQTGVVGQPNGQAKNATEADKDQALLAQSVTNQQVAGTRSNAVRSEIQKILDRTGKLGKEPDNVNYTAMKEGLKRLDTQLNEPVTKDNMLVSWRDLKKTYVWIASAAQQYVNSHKNPISPSGISRKKHARALLNLCRSDVTRLDYQIKTLDTIDQQSTWKQLLEKKPENAISSTLSVKKLAENKKTADPMLDILPVVGFKVMTKEQFEVLSGQSMDQLPETYKKLGLLLDDYSEKLTLGAKGSMQENDDSRAILNQILTLTKQYVNDIQEHKTASTGNENPKLVFAINTLQSQCNKILNPKSNVAASTPANRLHGSLSMPGKVNEEIELQDLLTGNAQKDKTPKADPPVTGMVKEAPKKVTPQPEAPKKVIPQPEAPKKEVPKEAPKVGNQSVPVPNGIVPMGARRGRGLFSKVKLAVNFAALPENYKELGTLIEEYGSLENSRQGEEVLKAKLEEISVLAKEYLLDSTIPKEKRQNTISAIRYNADVAINKINRGENVLPQNGQQPVLLRSRNLLPLPPKPAAQKPLPPLPPKPAAQKPLPPLPPKPVAQKPLPPAPKKPLPSVPQEQLPPAPKKPLPSVPIEQLPPAPKKPLPSVPQEQLPPAPKKPLPSVPQEQLPPAPKKPLPSVPIEQLPPAPKKPLPSVPKEQLPPAPKKPLPSIPQEEQAEPVVQESEQTQSGEPVTQETQQTEENRKQQEANTTEAAQQQEEPPQQQPQTPEPAGPSMRKEFLDMMKAAVERGGRLINPGYRALIEHLEELNTLLGETITETNQKDSWKKLQEAYGSLAAESGQYAKTHAAASTPLGRECRRHARMLLFLCKADMNTLRIAIRDKELAKKNTTWRQILEQPAASATQQTETQQTETQQTETQQTETQQTETQQTETQQTETQQTEAQQQTTTQDVAQTNQPKGNPARDFRNLELSLSGSAKGGIGWNSKYYNRVKAALEQTAKAMEQGFSRDSKDNMRKLSEAAAALQALQAACQAYTARNPGTQSGKNRKNIVLQIQKYAAQDVLGCEKAISDFIGMTPEDQAKQTWTSVIQKARSVQITVGNFENLPSPKKGQVSDVSIIESGEGAQKTVQYFKKEDSLDMSSGARMKGKIPDAKLPFYMAIQATLKEYPNLSKEDKKQLELDLGNGATRPKLSKEGEKAEKCYYNYLKKHRTGISETMLPTGILEEGGNANMSRRNVATSRMASLLGLEHLVAKSQTVDILDQATGQTIRGNLMDQAEGVELEKVEQSLKDKKVSSGFIHDTMNLQVLDMLCGQVDRHASNMLYKADEDGIVYGIQGIDNDGSFGTNEDAVSGKTWGRRDAKVFDKDTGEMIIPYMDRQLADRIMALDPEMVRYVLRDLLKEAEIDAAVKRLKVMQDNIPKALEKHKERFLEKEEDWNKDTVGEKLVTSFQSEWKLGIYSENKFSDILKAHPEIVEVFGIDSKMEDDLKLWDSDRLGFYQKYKDKAEKKAEKMKELQGKIVVYLMNKHGGNRNYYGRLVTPTKMGM